MRKKNRPKSKETPEWVAQKRIAEWKKTPLRVLWMPRGG